MAAAFPRLAALAFGLALAGCQMALPFGGGNPAETKANPITGEAIEVTALDPVPAGRAAVPVPVAAPAADAASVMEGPKAAYPVPEAEKSAARLACDKKKGVWSKAPNGSHSCVSYTRDGGKQCRKAGDCQGDCLARSNTCAPVTPLLGCSEVLDQSGRRMTMCLD